MNILYYIVAIAVLGATGIPGWWLYARATARNKVLTLDLANHEQDIKYLKDQIELERRANEVLAKKLVALGIAPGAGDLNLVGDRLRKESQSPD